VTSAGVAGNIQAFLDAGKKYIVSTGGANGAFTCGSDANFDKFISTYYSANLIGIDFDIEGGVSESGPNHRVGQACQLLNFNLFSSQIFTNFPVVVMGKIYQQLWEIIRDNVFKIHFINIPPKIVNPLGLGVTIRENVLMFIS